MDEDGVSDQIGDEVMVHVEATLRDWSNLDGPLEYLGEDIQAIAETVYK